MWEQSCSSHNDHSFHAKIILGRAKSFLMYAYGFVQCHVIGVTVHLCNFTAIDSVQREFTNTVYEQW